MESWIEFDDDALVLDAVNGVLERRKYFREKKRSYRQKEQHELESLRTQLAQLQLHVKQLAQHQTQRRNKDARRNDSAVSWRTVAMHTKQQSHLVTVEHDELSQRVAASRKLVGAMQQWVLLAESIPISPKVIVRWQHVPLSEQPNSRKFGMEWATQQMYHNTDAAFRTFPQSSPHDEFVAFNFEVADEWVNFSESAQYVWPAPLEVARFMLRHHLKDIAVGFNTREYFRNKRRNYRQRDRDEIERLSAEVQELTARLQSLQVQHKVDLHPVNQDELALSWRTITRRLRGEARVCQAERDVLVERFKVQMQLAREMQQWVMVTESIPVSPSTLIPWQHVALSAHPFHRKHCKEWATQQMYHNTDAAFQAFPRACLDDEIFTFDLEVTEMCISFASYSQIIWPAPLETVRFILRHHLNDISFGPVQFVAIEWTENTVLFQYKASIPRDDEAKSISRAVQALFYEADRCVFVLRQIQGDGLSEVPLRQQQDLLWMDLRPLDDAKTCTRIANFGSLHLADAGVDNLDAMAAGLGEDTSGMEEAEKIAVLRRVLRERAWSGDDTFRRHLAANLDKLRHEARLS
ncbi:unnamed protein product [Aphanomyces euteiches]